MRGAYLRGAYLRGANLEGAYLRGANLRGANLEGANLRGADGEKIKIQKIAVFIGIYKYICIPFISENGTQYVKMGCYTRTVKEWNKDFWNNPTEFLNKDNIETKLRLLAYKTAKSWLKLNK